MKPTRPYHAFTGYHREPGGLRRLDFFVDRIQAYAGQTPAHEIRILDVGCGKGNIALPLASLGYQVTGVDYDSTSILAARSSAEDLDVSATFLTGSLEQVSGQTFDIIIASEVLEHQKDPNAFLSHLKRLCVPHGRVLLSVPNGKSLEERLRKWTTQTKLGGRFKRYVKRHVTHQDVQSAASHPHEQFFSWSALERVLTAGGWKIRTVSGASAWFKEFYYLFGRVFVRRGSNAFHALDRLDQMMTSMLPRRVADGWLMEIRVVDPNRPSVLHVVTSLSSGGAERLVYELTARLPAFGFEAETVSLFGGGPVLRAFLGSNTPVTVFHKRGVFGWRTFVRLWAFIRRERPSIVHTHLFGADVFGRVAAFFSGVPAVLSTEHSVNKDHGAIKRNIKSALASITTRFVAVSNEAKQYMQDREHIPSKKIVVIENGIDISRAIPRSPGPFHDIPRLLCVGRLVPQKDHATLLKALALVKRPWMLRIVGTGELEKDLRSLAERLNIDSRIQWLGFREDVPSLLANSDLFCFPSKWEGLGLAFLEAAAAGIPIIASNLPVFKEVITDEHATFVPPADVPAWAHAIDEILRDPINAVSRAQAARTSVMQSYSIERMVERYAQTYRELLKI